MGIWTRWRKGQRGDCHKARERKPQQEFLVGRIFEKYRWLQMMLDRNVLITGLLLLALLLADILILHRFIPEIDTIEHFLFGFVLSDVSARFAGFYGLDRRLQKLGISPKGANLTIRLLGFLLVGGLLWELIELLVFPFFGVPYNPFLAFPPTLRNIDGALDVGVGTLGCLIAWHVGVSKAKPASANLRT
ncbi:MAG: hypothetical protein NWE81_02400 [Candidatus Bathyarchaeota archaeon]|nr:hypothetical protein [Candidatus Bathyarchaeota archaeon]